MNVSLDGGVGFLDLKTEALTGSYRQNSDQLSFRSIAEQEEEKRTQEQQSEHTPGLPFPGQETPEERQRIEQLKNKAMQIASQAEGELTSEQEAQIKDIQQEIGKISGEPMSENLAAKAKEAAKQNKLEEEYIPEEDSKPEDNMGQFGEAGSEFGFGQNGPGMGMLRQNALVTSIKMGSGPGGLGSMS